MSCFSLVHYQFLLLTWLGLQGGQITNDYRKSFYLYSVIYFQSNISTLTFTLQSATIR